MHECVQVHFAVAGPCPSPLYFKTHTSKLTDITHRPFLVDRRSVTSRSGYTCMRRFTSQSPTAACTTSSSLTCECMHLLIVIVALKDGCMGEQHMTQLAHACKFAWWNVMFPEGVSTLSQSHDNPLSSSLLWACVCFSSAKNFSSH